MPPKLGQFDSVKLTPSFNSSGATIVPDRSLRASSTLRGMLGYLADPDADGLDGGADGAHAQTQLEGPAPSQETEGGSQLGYAPTFSRLLGGDGAPASQPPASPAAPAPRLPSSPETMSQSASKYWRREDSFIHRLEEIHGPGAAVGLLQHGGLGDFPLQQTASGSLDFDAILDGTPSPAVTSISPSQINGGALSPFGAAATPPSLPYRPSSAASSRSSVSAHGRPSHAAGPAPAGPSVHLFDAYAARDHAASDYTLSTTDVSDDMDTDDAASLHSVNADDAAGRPGDVGVSVGGLHLGDGPRRGSAGARAAAQAAAKKRPADDDEERERLERLEHRRDINRRSARKHRLRRKEEVDGLQGEIRARDAALKQKDGEIAELRAELKVLREQVQKLTSALVDR